MEAPQAEMSVVGRILRVFYAPAETFEAVAEQRSAADWLVPTALVAVVIFVSTYLTMPIYMEAMEQMREQVPAERPSMEGTGEAMRISGLVAAPVMTFVMLFIGAAIYLLVGKLLGGLLSYGHCLPIVAYTSLIAILQHVVKTPLVLANETMDVQIGLGMFLSEEARAKFRGPLIVPHRSLCRLDGRRRRSWAVYRRADRAQPRLCRRCGHYADLPRHRRVFRHPRTRRLRWRPISAAC